MSLKYFPWVKFLVFILVSNLASSCYFFRKRSPGDQPSATSGVVGESLGEKAGGLDEAALAVVHQVTSSYPAAAIRPDPDMVVRNLLLEYRDQGATVAREIGRVESFRLLLGGASQDFTITPQKSYDATSLLAKLKVAEEICTGLVAPDDRQHSGWDSILPAEPADTDTNIRFLTQRLHGVPSSQIESTTLTSLTAILNTALEDNEITMASYVPVCATLVIDANFLLL